MRNIRLFIPLLNMSGKTTNLFIASIRINQMHNNLLKTDVNSISEPLIKSEVPATHGGVAIFINPSY